MFVYRCRRRHSLSCAATHAPRGDGGRRCARACCGAERRLPWRPYGSGRHTAVVMAVCAGRLHSLRRGYRAPPWHVRCARGSAGRRGTRCGGERWRQASSLSANRVPKWHSDVSQSGCKQRRGRGAGCTACSRSRRGLPLAACCARRWAGGDTQGESKPRCEAGVCPEHSVRGRCRCRGLLHCAAPQWLRRRPASCTGGDAPCAAGNILHTLSINAGHHLRACCPACFHYIWGRRCGAQPQVTSLLGWWPGRSCDGACRIRRLEVRRKLHYIYPMPGLGVFAAW